MTQNNQWNDFQIPNRLNVEQETLTERYGKFYAQPFERGFGTTIGNSLRRALLSSIEGAAITAIKIEVARLRSIETRCSVVLPNLRCAFKCLIFIK